MYFGDWGRIMNILFIILFCGTLTYFAFVDTRKGFRYALPLFLRVFVPMILTGIIVKIPQLLKLTQKEDVVSYIIGAIGAVIFYIVLFKVFKKENSKRNLNVLDYFVGFLIGTFRGWLYFGFAMVYLNKLFGLNTSVFNGTTAGQVLTAMITPAKWVLFLGFF